MTSADAALAHIEASLPDNWVMQTIQIDEVDDYVVLLCRRGPAPLSERPRRILGHGRTVAAALWDAARQLDELIVRKA